MNNNVASLQSVRKFLFRCLSDTDLEPEFVFFLKMNLCTLTFGIVPAFLVASEDIYLRCQMF